MGLVILLLFAILFWLLSYVSPWERLSNGPIGHVVAAVISAALTGGIWFSLPKQVTGSSDLQEPLLLGIALFLLCSIIGWALVFCPRKQPARNIFSYMTEGAAGYLGITAISIVLLAGIIWGAGLAMSQPIVKNPNGAIASLPKVFSTGEKTVTAPIEVGDEFQPVELDIDFSLLSRLEFTSDKSVVIVDADNSADLRRVPVRVGSGETITWTRAQRLQDLPIPYEVGSGLYIQNKEIDPATVTIRYITNPPVPEAVSLIITAMTVTLIGLGLMLQQAVAPRASAVAHATVKNELAQPLFLVLMLLGVISIILYEFLSFNTFGEDIKLLKDCGITTIMLLAAFQGIWSASSSISEEIEGKTALTVLSKPIQRRSFVIGKFLGIFWVLMLMFVILGSIELGAVAYKPLYDARESSAEAPVWQLCHAEMLSTVPGLAMGFMQSVVLMSISVALATRLPQLANLSVCFAIYVIGNLTTQLVSSTQEGFEIVKFVASLVATIIPILEHFSLQAAIDSGNRITMSLLSGNLIYCLLYVMLAMFLALLLFEDRDLA